MLGLMFRAYRVGGRRIGPTKPKGDIMILLAFILLVLLFDAFAVTLGEDTALRG
jgi:hypothetical protein